MSENQIEQLTNSIDELTNEINELKQLFKCDFTNNNIASAVLALANAINDSNKQIEMREK